MSPCSPGVAEGLCRLTGSPRRRGEAPGSDEQRPQLAHCSVRTGSFPDPSAQQAWLCSVLCQCGMPCAHDSDTLDLGRADSKPPKSRPLRLLLREFAPLLRAGPVGIDPWAPSSGRQEPFCVSGHKDGCLGRHEYSFRVHLSNQTLPPATPPWAPRAVPTPAETLSCMWLMALQNVLRFEFPLFFPCG